MQHRPQKLQVIHGERVRIQAASSCASAGQMKKHALNLHTSSSAFIFHKGKEGWDSPAHMLNCIIIIDAGQVKKYAFASLSAILHTYGKRRGAVRGGGGGRLTCPHVMQHRLACAGAAWVQPAWLNHDAPICRTHQQQLAAYACAQRTSSLYTQRTKSTLIIIRQHLRSSLRSLQAAMHALEVQPRAHSRCAHSL